MSCSDIKHLKKILKIIFNIASIGFIILIGFLVISVLVTQDKSEPVQSNIEIIESKTEPTINEKLKRFLENPIDLKDYKSIKKQSLSSATNGLDYYFKPEINDSIYYHYTTFPNDSLWSEIAPIDIIVFKYGNKKHLWNDDAEILIEFTVFGNDHDLKKANLVGTTKAKLESNFGVEYKNFDNLIVYSDKNKALIIELENSKVKWFRYIKLNTENIDGELIKKIMKN